MTADAPPAGPVCAGAPSSARMAPLAALSRGALPKLLAAVALAPAARSARAAGRQSAAAAQCSGVSPNTCGPLRPGDGVGWHALAHRVDGVRVCARRKQR